MYDKKTKIVVTIGPSTWDPEVMKNMIESGMNCARVNGAFADREELEKVTNLVRNISSEVSLMIDVKGPQIRLNKFAEAKELKIGDIIEIGSSDQAEIYPLSYPDLYKYLTVGQKIIGGDGDVEMVVKEIKDGVMYCEVTYGNILKPAKGITVPNAKYAATTLTEKDIENIGHCNDLGWDFVSASFIRSAAAAKEVRTAMGANTKMKLIAKIENQAGVDNIDEILPEVDGIMIGRGDLGLQLGLEKVPMVQRMLIKKCNDAGKPVITATQMFESMITNPRPTRAEVNDVATAILLRTDSIMLSAETTTGEYPVEAVQYMKKIANEIEPQVEPQIIEARTGGPIATDALTKAVAQMAIEMDKEVDVVIVVSRTGRTARTIGRHCIKQPMYVFVSDEVYLRELSISKGVNRAFVLDRVEKNRDSAVQAVLDKASELNLFKAGQRVLLISKTPVGGEEYFPNVFEVINV